MFDAETEPTGQTIHRSGPFRGLPTPPPLPAASGRSTVASRPPGSRLTQVARSRQGLARRRNEDAWAIEAELGLYVVADGVGGGRDGHRAARLATHAVVLQIDTANRRAWRRDPVTVLAEAVEEANRVVYRESQGPAGLGTMATTIVALWIRGTHAALAHVGDSRAYRLRGERLDTLTSDHTLATTLQRAGLLSPRAATSRMANLLTRAIGSAPDVEVDSRLLAVSEGDRFLLCSDGLTKTHQDQRLRASLAQLGDVDLVVDQLVPGDDTFVGRDDTTAILVEVGRRSGESGQWTADS